MFVLRSIATGSRHAQLPPLSSVNSIMGLCSFGCRTTELCPAAAMSSSNSRRPRLAALLSASSHGEQNATTGHGPLNGGPKSRSVRSQSGTMRIQEWELPARPRSWICDAGEEVAAERREAVGMHAWPRSRGLRRRWLLQAMLTMRPISPVLPVFGGCHLFLHLCSSMTPQINETKSQQCRPQERQGGRFGNGGIGVGECAIETA